MRRYRLHLTNARHRIDVIAERFGFEFRTPIGFRGDTAICIVAAQPEDIARANAAEVPGLTLGRLRP